jgi:hypothetical protein
MLKMKRAQNSIRNQKGMAVIEALPLLVVFVMLVSFGLGFYGVIHTSTLHSIAARTYAFETFRNRANLYYYREEGSGLDRPLHLGKKGYRYHAIQNEYDDRQNFVASTRPISIGRAIASTKATEEVHNLKVYSLDRRNEKVDVNPVWIMIAYGICLNAQCGE